MVDSTLNPVSIDCVMIFHVGGFFHTVAGENEPLVAEITEILSVGGRLVKARLFGSGQLFSDLSICFCIYISIYYFSSTSS